MLNIYTRENNFANAKKPYSFHSQICGTVTQDEIIERIANAGTTVTKADAAAVIAEFEHQITYALRDGYAVKLFCGTIKPGASGTAEKSDETFRPKPPLDNRTPKRDHKIKLLFEQSKSFVKHLTDTIQYKRSKSTSFCSPYISSFHVPYSKTPDKFFADDFIQLHGNFLKFDAGDTNQGVFFVSTSTGKETRAQKYSRITRLNVTAVLPATLPAGDHAVQVRTVVSGKTHYSNGTKICVFPAES